MTRPAWALLLGDLMNTKIGGLAFFPGKGACACACDACAFYWYACAPASDTLMWICKDLRSPNLSSVQSSTRHGSWDSRDPGFDEAVALSI